MEYKYGLFEAFGIEAEYMVVDMDTLNIKAIADQVLKVLNAGEQTNEVEIGDIAWSNELVNHVLELKCNGPQKDLLRIEKSFHHAIVEMNKVLDKYNAVLMPTAMHPWMNPDKETVLWPHGQQEIYNKYNEIFNCSGHGWSNLQSVHINLPFKNEEEFSKLHQAIRYVLPIIPAFVASSPICEGKVSEFADIRLSYYEKNQSKIPRIIGNIIPENIQTFAEYHLMLEEIYQQIAPYDQDKILQEPWLNSRAAILKEDVGAIEIRLMDIQESPRMDFIFIHLFVEMIKFSIDNLSNMNLSEQELREVYNTSRYLNKSKNHGKYNKFFGFEENLSLKNLTINLLNRFKEVIPAEYHQNLEALKSFGTLADRIIENGDTKEVYKKLTECLAKNKMYEV